MTQPDEEFNIALELTSKLAKGSKKARQELERLVRNLEGGTADVIDIYNNTVGDLILETVTDPQLQFVSREGNSWELWRH